MKLLINTRQSLVRMFNRTSKPFSLKKLQLLTLKYKRKRNDFQMIDEMTGNNFEIGHVKLLTIFNVSNEGELNDAFR